MSIVYFANYQNVKGICPKCGQLAKLIQSLDDGAYYWDHDNSRDRFIVHTEACGILRLGLGHKTLEGLEDVGTAILYEPGSRRFQPRVVEL